MGSFLGPLGALNSSSLAASAQKAQARLEPIQVGPGILPEGLPDGFLQACDLVRERVQAIVQGLPSSRFRGLFFGAFTRPKGPAEILATLTPPSPVENGEEPGLGDTAAALGN